MRPGNYLLLDITLPALPARINDMYATVQGHRVKSSEARSFANLTSQVIHRACPDFTIPSDVTDLEFYLVCYYPERGFGKKDPLTYNDSDTRLKSAKDSVFDASFTDPKTNKRANDRQVSMDFAFKDRGYPVMLEQYPQGYCSVKLALPGHTLAVLRRLGIT
jgi:hypothetical protein